MYLKQIIAASSFLVLAPFFFIVNKSINKNYTYYNYTFIAPLGFSFWNILSFILTKSLNLSTKQRFIFTTLLSYLSMVIISKKYKTYNYNHKQWNLYYIKLFLLYIFAWSTIFYIEKIIS